MPWFSSKEQRQIGLPDLPLTTSPQPAMEEKAGAPGFGYFSSLGTTAFMQRNPAAFARDGYIENAVVAACIRLIASACASVELVIERGKNGKVLSTHPMLDLMMSPNPAQSGHELLEALVSNDLIFGDAYVTRLPTAKGQVNQPSELWLPQPNHVSMLAPPGFGLPISYTYNPGGSPIVFPVNQLNGRCDLLHIRRYNPLDAHRGLSLMEPAAYSIDTHNSSLKSNKRLLDNGGRPQGALVQQANKDGSFPTFSPEQATDLRQQLQEQVAGAQNSGRPLVLGGGLDWKEMGLKPRDLEFTSGIWLSAMHICMCYNVPPQMLGIPGSQTRANFEQADLSFWQQTVIPTLNRELSALNRWLAPMFGDVTLRIVADLNSVPALEPQRQILFDRAENCTFITIDEKRNMVGLGPLTTEQEKELLVPNTMTTFDMLTAELPEPDAGGDTDPSDPDNEEDEEDEGAPPSGSEENEEDEAV